MTSKTIARTSLMLALAVMSQFFKNLSVYITGPIINCILIISVIYCGIGSGVFLSVALPVSSLLITGSPIITAIPVILPCIMGGNLILTLMVWLMVKNSGTDMQFLLAVGTGCIAKAIFMTLTISCLVLGLMGQGLGLPEKALTAAKLTFSITQLTTGLLGAVLAYAIKKALGKSVL